MEPVDALAWRRVRVGGGAGPIKMGCRTHRGRTGSSMWGKWG